MTTASTDSPTLLTPRVLFPFILVTLIWSSTWIVIRDQLAVVPPSWSVCYRFGLAGAAMMLLAAVQGKRLLLDRPAIGFTLLLGLAQFSINFNFVYRAEAYVTSGLVAVMFALLIVPNTLLSRLFLGATVSRPFLIGASIAVAGVALMLLHEYRASPLDPEGVWIGAALTAVGIMGASIANVMQATDFARRQDIIVMLAWAMLWGTLASASWAWATAGPPVIEWRAGYLSGIAYLGLAGSVVTFPLYFRIIREVGPGPAAWSSVLIPVIAMAISTAVEGYRWTLLAGIGVALVCLGLIIALKPGAGQARR